MLDIRDRYPQYGLILYACFSGKLTSRRTLSISIIIQNFPCVTYSVESSCNKGGGGRESPPGHMITLVLRVSG